jgi:hypothetical protein
MNLETVSIQVNGTLADWISQRAKRNTRTPLQELTHMLTPFMVREYQAQQRKAQKQLQALQQ